MYSSIPLYSTTLSLAKEYTCACLLLRWRKLCGRRYVQLAHHCLVLKDEVFASVSSGHDSSGMIHDVVAERSRLFLCPVNHGLCWCLVNKKRRKCTMLLVSAVGSKQLPNFAGKQFNFIWGTKYFNGNSRDFRTQVDSHFPLPYLCVVSGSTTVLVVCNFEGFLEIHTFHQSGKAQSNAKEWNCNVCPWHEWPESEHGSIRSVATQSWRGT